MTANTILAEIEAQEAELVFTVFNEDTAYAVGTTLVEAARREAAPVVIDIRTPDRTLFHVALPGSAPDNDHWARRKSSTVFRIHHASLLVGERLKAKGDTVGTHLGLDPLDHSAHGGSFPIRVAGVGVVAAVTVSGLPQVEDHAMVVEALRAYFARAA